PRRRSAPLLHGPFGAGGVLSARLRFRLVLSATRRSAQLSQQGDRGLAGAGAEKSAYHRLMYPSALAEGVERAAAAGGVHYRERSLRIGRHAWRARARDETVGEAHGRNIAGSVRCGGDRPTSRRREKRAAQQ